VIIKFVYADYVGDVPGKKDNWDAMIGTPRTFRDFIDILVNSGKLPGEYLQRSQEGAYGGIEELVLKTKSFNLVSFLENYRIQYYEYAAEKGSLIDAAKTYHIKTTTAIESEIKRLIPPTFDKERRLTTLFEKASPLLGVEETILILIFYEREGASDEREQAWASVKRSRPNDHQSDSPDLTNSFATDALGHLTRILIDGGLVDIPEEYPREGAIQYVTRVLGAQPDFTLPIARSEIRQAFSSLRSEKDSLLRTLSANNIPLSEGDRAEFEKRLPGGDTLSYIVASLVGPTKVPDFILLLLYYDFTAQTRKRDDLFKGLKRESAKLSALARKLLNRKLVSIVERNERENSENISNLAAYLFTAKEFTKPVIDSTFSDYSRLFEYSRTVLDFQNPEDFEKAGARIKDLLTDTVMKLKNRKIPVSELAFNVVMGKPTAKYADTTPQHVRAAQQLEMKGREIKAGDIISFVKTKAPPFVKPAELARPEEIDVEKYIEYARSMFDRVLDALDFSFDEIMGATTLDFFWGQ
jgi:hypothetical protein